MNMDCKRLCEICKVQFLGPKIIFENSQTRGKHNTSGARIYLSARISECFNFLDSKEDGRASNKRIYTKLVSARDEAKTKKLSGSWTNFLVR